MQTMKDAVALVTGASSDIGRAIALRLASAGAQVMALGRDRRKLAEVAAADTGRIQPLVADLTLAADIASVRRLLDQRGRLDVLVLGSGIYERSTDPEVFARQFASNVQGPYTLLQALLPLLSAAEGLVIFLNSTQGLSASPGVGQYAATQHAMRALADSLRQEVKGIRVSSLFLGRTASARQEAIFALEQRTYMPELLLQPADIAALVLILAQLADTAEITEIKIRPRLNSYGNADPGGSRQSAM
jgi:NADP-dependent 3-hydroxy acid dehydrogenase YdfG